MPVLHHVFHSDFLVVPNALAQDQKLAFRDRGLLLYMLSLPQDWSFNLRSLCSASAFEHRDALRASLDRIEEAGYLDRQRQRDGGKLGTVVWTVTDVPGSPCSDNPNKESPRSDFPYSAEPTSGNPTLHNIELTKYTSDKSAEDSFERFWSLYPRKTARKSAAREFVLSLEKVDLDTLLTAVKAWSASDEWQREAGRYVPQAWRWLSEERWTDSPPSPAPEGEKISSCSGRWIETGEIMPDGSPAVRWEEGTEND